MKSVIFQYWVGPATPGCDYSQELVSAYAKEVGADYRFENNVFIKNRGKAQSYVDAIRPVYDESFWDYDRVLYLDIDIFPVGDLKENIFDLEVGDFGMCEEPDQPSMREEATREGCKISGEWDERWAREVQQKWGRVDFPRDEKKRLRTFNSGVILFSREGLRNCRRKFISALEYSQHMRRRGFHQLYCMDQAHLNCMAFGKGLNFTPLDVEWNRQVHGLRNSEKIYDRRNERTKFVHIQIGAADHKSRRFHWERVNLPQSQWKTFE